MKWMNNSLLPNHIKIYCLQKLGHQTQKGSHASLQSWHGKRIPACDPRWTWAKTERKEPYWVLPEQNSSCYPWQKPAFFKTFPSLSLRTPWFGGSWHRRARRVEALRMDLRLWRRSGFRQDLHHRGKPLPQCQGQDKGWGYRAVTPGCWEGTRGWAAGWHLQWSLDKPRLTSLRGLPHQPSNGGWFAESGAHPKSMVEVQEEPENMCVWSHGLSWVSDPAKPSAGRWLSWPGFAGLNCGLLSVIGITTFQHLR